MPWLWWRPPCLLQPVIVNLKSDDTALRAVLWRMQGPWMVFRDVSMLKARVDPVPVDGEIVVHRDNVAFLQVLSR